MTAENASYGSQVLESLKRIERLVTALVKAELAETTEREFGDKKLRKLYDLTGDVPVKQLASDLGLSTGSISRTWQRWEELGLLVKEGAKYRRIL